MRIQYQYPGELLMSRATSKDTTVHLGVHPIKQETHRFRTNGFTTSKLGRALLEITHTAKITHPTPRRRHPKPYHHPRRRPKRQGRSHPNKQGVTDLPYGSPPRNRRTFPCHQNKTVSQLSSTSAQIIQEETPPKHILTTHETQGSGDKAYNQNP